MPGPRFPRFSSCNSESESWWTRIRENLANVIAPARFSPTAANGAPIHLLKFARSRAATRAQTVSAVMHLSLFAALVLLAIHVPGSGRNSVSSAPLGGSVPLLSPRILKLLGSHGSSGAGSSGDLIPIPATTGNLPRRSAIEVVRPSIPQDRHSELPVPPTLLDASAPSVLISIDKIGLPWMPNETNSPGPGKGHGIGSADGDSMGDSGTGPAGYGGSDGTYAPRTILPACVYCPLPVYTDEARKVKMQGTVTMRVLVGADGRASDVRVVRGVGYGLDERAMQTVRTWRFSAARDPAHRVIAAWIIVEAVFRLF
jgi:periplasmic protein TonB